MGHECYKRLELQPCQASLSPCPVCGSAVGLWQYSDTETDPVTRVVMCENGDEIGPESETLVAGCLLYMPPNRFYKATARDAIKWWNTWSQAVVAQRMVRALG